MIITLYGPDDYRREAKKREIVEQFSSKHPNGDIGRFDISTEEGLASFRRFIGSMSMFETSKLAIVEGLYESDLKIVPDILRTSTDIQSLAVLISEDGTPPKKLDFLVKKSTAKSKKSLNQISQKFELLKGLAFESFLREYASILGLVLEPAALKLILKVSESNTWRAVTELDKAACLGKKNIGPNDLGTMALELKPDFWGLVNAFKSSDASQRIIALNSIFSSNEPAGKMFNILAYQLPQKIKAIARYDLLVKSGKMDYEEALVDLAIN